MPAGPGPDRKKIRGRIRESAGAPCPPRVGDDCAKLTKMTSCDRWWLLTALCSGALLIFLFQGRGCDPGGGNLVKESNVERPVGGNPVARRPPPAARRSSLGDLADRDPSRLALRKHSWSDEVKLEIVVTDRSDGTAVEHAEVRVSQPTMDFLSEGFTDLSGVATSRLMAGVYRVEIDKSGFLPEAFDLQVPAGRGAAENTGGVDGGGRARRVSCQPARQAGCRCPDFCRPASGWGSSAG